MGLPFRCFRQYNGFRKIKPPMPASVRPCQARTVKFIQRKLCRQLSVKLRHYMVVVQRQMHLFYTVYAIFSGMLIFCVESEEALIIELA